MTGFAAARAALLPALEGVATADLIQALADGGPPFAALIVEQQLGPLWHARTAATVFAERRDHSALLYMWQASALGQIDDLFTRANIRYAVIKGAATREVLFDDPSLRVCSDLDILVAPDQRVDAARALVTAGYRMHMDPSVISHEVMVSKGPVTVDLHWDVVRPGRTRICVVDGLLTRRQRQGNWWRISDDDALFLMLTHNAVSKHVSSAQMALHRVADLMLWWQRRDVDWPVVHAQLLATGLTAAAWTVLTWVRMMSPAPLGAAFGAAIHSLTPGRLRAAYLKGWLDHDLSSRLAHIHALRLMGFSLFLHDRPSDAWHALGGWSRAKRSRATDVLSFDGLSDPQAGR